MAGRRLPSSSNTWAGPERRPAALVHRASQTLADEWMRRKIVNCRLDRCYGIPRCGMDLVVALTRQSPAASSTPEHHLHNRPRRLCRSVDVARRALDGRVLVAEGFKEDIGEGRAVERLLRKVGNCLPQLNSNQHRPQAAAETQDSMKGRFVLKPRAQAGTYTRQRPKHIQAVADNPPLGRECEEVRAGYRKCPSGSDVLQDGPHRRSGLLRPRKAAA